VFNDEQLASVLTYVRREWGHTASPVSPAMVKDVRDATADRTRPWTAEQLSSVK
jgi:mono/diheme cytochrome c family protein